MPAIGDAGQRIRTRQMFELLIGTAEIVEQAAFAGMAELLPHFQQVSGALFELEAIQRYQGEQAGREKYEVKSLLDLRSQESDQRQPKDRKGEDYDGTRHGVPESYPLDCIEIDDR